MNDIMSMALATPDDVDADQVSQSTRDEATLRAATIRVGIGRFIDVVVPELAAAWAGRDWIALGYDSWESYVTGELGVDRLKLSRIGRQQAIGTFRLAGMSTRAIGAALGVDPKTVRNDIADGDIASPEHVTGTDGRTYPTARPAAADDEDDTARPDDDDDEFVDVDDDDDLTDDPDFETFVDVGQDDPDEPDPVTPDSDWLESSSEGGAVTSSTPGNATDEAPADVDPDVEYDAWRSRIYSELSNAGRHLVNLTGDWQDADVFATRASEKQMLWLVDVGEKITDFIARVQGLRSPTVAPVDPARSPLDRAYRSMRDRAGDTDRPSWVWISAGRQGVDFHDIECGPVMNRNTDLTVCGRSTRSGTVLVIAAAIDKHGAKPCPRCWPEPKEA